MSFYCQRRSCSESWSYNPAIFSTQLAKGDVTMRFAVLMAILAGLTTVTVAAQADSKKVEVAVQTALGSVAQCNKNNPNTPCNVFVCDALRLAYGGSVAEEFLASGECVKAD